MSERSEPSTQPLDFFRAIWPTTGLYCITVLKEGQPRNQFFPTMEEAAAFALAADARGIPTYHACATYRADGERNKYGFLRRTQANVAAVKALWMDIDVGEGKPYAAPADALDAVKQFVAASGLPEPSCVYSGSGWHLYWVLDREIPPDQWRARSEVLKGCAAALGLAADPSRTGDVASILRPPGTHNRKRGAGTLVLAGAFGCASLDAIDAALGTTIALPGGGLGLGTTPEIANAVDNKKFQVQASGQGEPAYANVIAEHCGQLRNFRDRRGQLPEPEWYASLCVLAHCADGEKLGHEWSAGDVRYNPRDTQRKLEHARKDSGPTTCVRFQGTNPVPCMGCPHAGKITSPIVLGRGGGSVEPIASVSIPALKFPFAWGANRALTVAVDVTEDDTSPIRKYEYDVVYKAPIFVSHARRHELTNVFSIALQHWLPHEGWQEALLPWTDHSQKAVLNLLGAQGINVHGAHAKDMVRYLHDAIDDYQSQRKIDMEYAQFGWKGDFEGFLLGNEMFEPGKPPRVVGITPELHERARGMKAYGTFEGWRAAANGLFALERQGLMVVAGFASLLMAFAQEAGGLILAAVSEEGGKGKTLGLRGAQTAWGTDSVTAISKADTINSRFKLISLLGGLPVTWDEMRDRDPEVVKDFVLTFSGGRDKNRLDKNAALKQNARNWSTMLIATSNISVAELVSHDGETAQQARIMEAFFEDLVGVKASDGKDLERSLIANRGHAGKRFIQALMIPGMIDWCRQAVPTYAKEYEKQLGEHNTVLRFYTNGLACLKAASVILNRAGILEFGTDRLMKYAVEVAMGMAGKLVDVRGDPVYLLTQFINQSWNNLLGVQEAWKPKQNAMPFHTPKGTLAIRYEREPGRIYIDRQFLKDWCAKKRVMFGNLSAKLLEIGIVSSVDKKISLGAGTTYAAGGQTIAWEVHVPALPGLELPVGRVDNVVAMR